VDRFAVTTADIRGEGDFKRRVRCEPAGSRVNSTSCVDFRNGFGQGVIKLRRGFNLTREQDRRPGIKKEAPRSLKSKHHILVRSRKSLGNFTGFSLGQMDEESFVWCMVEKENKTKTRTKEGGS
jgi:hypothetical protein